MNNGAPRRVVFKPEMSEKEYLRTTLFDMAANEKLPDDIFEAEFSPVTCDTVQAIAINSSFNFSYTVSIGYDRKEERVTYNQFTKKHETHYETVTDWHPMSGNYSCSANGYAENSDSADSNLNKYIERAYSTAKAESAVEYDASSGDVPPLTQANPYALNLARNDTNYKAECMCLRELPGNRRKDLKTNGSDSHRLTSTFTLPRYSVSYTYNGESYKTSSFAVGNHEKWGTSPRSNMTQQANVNTTVETMMIASVGLSCLAILLSFIISFLVGAVLSLGALALLIYQIRIMPAKIKEECDEAENKKLSGLNAQLKKHGLAPATEEEIASTFRYVENAKSEANNKSYLFISGLFYLFSSIFTQTIYIVPLLIGGYALYKFIKKKINEKKNK